MDTFKTITYSGGHSTKYRILDNQTAYHADTPPRIVAILEAARLRGTRLKLHYGDVKTGRPWGDIETGAIGRSTGLLNVPLCIANRRSTYGPAILDHCIVKIELSQGGLVLYPTSEDIV